jgi:hypothetical protein
MTLFLAILGIAIAAFSVTVGAYFSATIWGIIALAAAVQTTRRWWVS